MKTTLYLVRPAVIEGNARAVLGAPARRGRAADAGLRQAELTRDFLAVRSLDACYVCPQTSGMATARMIAAPHGLSPCVLETLDEPDFPDCATGDGAGAHRPGVLPLRSYPPGATAFTEMQTRVTDVVDELLGRHEGQSVLVVAHHTVLLVYLAKILRLTVAQAEVVRLDPCGVSLVVRTGGQTTIAMLNASFHLQGVAA